MPKYKLSPQERAAEQARKEQLLSLMSQFNVKGVGDFQGLFKEMVGTFLENGLESELEEELGYSKYDYRNKETDNSRNGHSRKSIMTSNGDLEIRIPRDRNAEFEPHLVKKHQNSLTNEIEEKILSLYAKGMSVSDIESHIREIYGLDCSESTISRISDKILPIVRDWQSRPLESVYAVVFMDAIHFKQKRVSAITDKFKNSKNIKADCLNLSVVRFYISAVFKFISNCRNSFLSAILRAYS